MVEATAVEMLSKISENCYFEFSCVHLRPKFSRAMPPLGDAARLQGGRAVGAVGPLNGPVLKIAAVTVSAQRAETTQAQIQFSTRLVGEVVVVTFVVGVRRPTAGNAVTRRKSRQGPGG